MNADYGKTLLTPTLAEAISVVAGALADVHFKPGGITVNWDSVPAVADDPITLLDGNVIPVGGKFLRYGTVMNMIDSVGASALAITGTPTGGSFKVGVSINGAQPLYTEDIAWNAVAAAIDTAIEALTGAGSVTVADSGVAPNLTHTVTAVEGGALSGKSVAFSVVSSLTGGTGAIAANNTASFNTYGTFGPADTAATDGREILQRGRTYLMEKTLVQESPWGGLGGGPSTRYWGVIETGLLWEARMLVAENAPQLPFANLPALADVLAVLPGVRLRTKSAGN